MHTKEYLRELQALPLDLKIKLTQQRIREWVNYYGEDGVYISFSGGKDSTVLLDVARDRYPDIKACFVDIPTQYPELKAFVKTFGNVDIVKPKINFFKVCEKFGFPLFSKEVSESVYYARKYLTTLEQQANALTDRQTDSRQIAHAYAMADLLGIERREKNQQADYQALLKGIIPSLDIENAPVRFKQLFGKAPNKEKGVLTNEYSKLYDRRKYLFMLDAPFEISNKCCKVMKKSPANEYARKTGRFPIIATMTEESRLRESSWLRYGCNAFESEHPKSNPMSFWTEQDVLEYIRQHDLKICSVYGDIVTDDEETGQITLADCGLQGFENKQPLHCTGCRRTGCVLCGFGAHIHGDDRFLKLKETHPKMYQFLDVAQNNGYTMRQAIEWVEEHSNISIKL